MQKIRLRTFEMFHELLGIPHSCIIKMAKRHKTPAGVESAPDLNTICESYPGVHLKIGSILGHLFYATVG